MYFPVVIVSALIVSPELVANDPQKPVPLYRVVGGAHGIPS